jgi:hypothetical protein
MIGWVAAVVSQLGVLNEIPTSAALSEATICPCPSTMSTSVKGEVPAANACCRIASAPFSEVWLLSMAGSSR